VPRGGGRHADRVTPTATRLGAASWLLATAVFFAAQPVVQSAWTTPYSWAANNISDLGNVSCGPWGDDGRYVCSPWHAGMNAAFVACGLLFAAGAVLLRRFGPGRTAPALLLAASAGWVIVGLAPADVNENLHVLAGVPLIFVAGNAVLLLSRHRAGVVLGVVGLTAMVLHLSGHFLGLGIGGMERVAAFPLPLWLAATAVLRWRHAERGAV
jgi:hypothetical membrane protein